MRPRLQFRLSLTSSFSSYGCGRAQLIGKHGSCFVKHLTTVSRSNAVIPDSRVCRGRIRPTLNRLSTCQRSPAALRDDCRGGRHDRNRIRLASTAALQDTEGSSAELPPYEPPTKGFISLLPRSVVPYAELLRLDKPTGTYYLYFPCLFSTLLAAPLADPITPPLAVLGTSMLFFAGAIIMRGAGCTINDLWDRNLDPHVRRTRLRPIARGAIKARKALVFSGFQLLAGLGILLQFPTECLWYGIPSLIFVATYPLAKRVTYYPQFVLGLTFSWGAIMGFPALGVDLLSNQAALAAAALLYSSNIAWTVLYDTIYAHMDVRDDAKAGIKSIAVKHERSTKSVMTGLAVLQIGLLAAAGAAAGAGPVFYVGSCGSAAAALAVMIRRVDLNNVSNCWWWFRYGCWFTGGGIALGLAGDYLAKLLGIYGDQPNPISIG